MSDQETKPTEAVDVPAVDSDTKIVDAPVEDSDVKITGTDVQATTVDESTDKGASTEKDAAAEGDVDKTAKARPSVRNPPEGMLKTTGRAISNDYKKNIKFDPSSLPETDDPDKIRAQVDFYFGDSNLPLDAHLWARVGGEENKPVPLADICSFKRMRRFQPYSAVVTALKSSKHLVVEGEEGKETVRRKQPYDPSKRQKVEDRSIYAKGFGDEEPSTQFDIEAFFTQYGTFNSVRLRRTSDKSFKGSVFVEWADKETAEKFLALDPEPKWRDHPLLIMSKLEYVTQKAEDIRNGNKEPNSSKSFGKGHRGGKNGRGRGNFRGDNNDWKKRRDHDQKNGFGDRRGGRGGHGRGRGRGSHRGRGGGRDRGGENGRAAAQEEPVDDREVGRPKIHTSAEGAKIVQEGNDSASKRAREDDGGEASERPAKKVDQKEATAEAA